jgi:hypothetical protein
MVVSPGKEMKRFILTLLAVPVLSFCGFGFLATFEALPPVTQWIWRSVYLGVALLTISGLIWSWISGPKGVE